MQVYYHFAVRQIHTNNELTRAVVATVAFIHFATGWLHMNTGLTIPTLSGLFSTVRIHMNTGRIILIILAAS